MVKARAEEGSMLVVVEAVDMVLITVQRGVRDGYKQHLSDHRIRCESQRVNINALMTPGRSPRTQRLPDAFSPGGLPS